MTSIAVETFSIVSLLAAATTGAPEMAADPGWSHAKLIAETFKEWLLGAAILVGGIWAYWKYIYSESLSAQRKAKRQESPPHVNISILPELYQLKDGSFNLVVDVSLEHAGTGELLVDLETVPPLLIIELLQGEDGEYDVPGEPRQPRIMSSLNIHNATIYPSGKLFLKFIENVKNESIYLIEFNSQVAETLVPQREKARADTERAAAEGDRTEKAVAEAKRMAKTDRQNRKNFTSRLATKIIHVGFPKVEPKEDGKPDGKKTKQQ